MIANLAIIFDISNEMHFIFSFFRAKYLSMDIFWLLHEARGLRLVDAQLHGGGG